MECLSVLDAVDTFVWKSVSERWCVLYVHWDDGGHLRAGLVLCSDV